MWWKALVAPVAQLFGKALDIIDEMVEEGLVTMEKVRVIKYRANGPR